MITGPQTWTPSEYMADPCDVPSLNPSIGWVLVNQSPRHAYHLHPRLGGARRKPKKEFDRGTLAHAYLLGKGEERIRLVDAVYGPKHERAGEPVDDYKTKDAQEQKKAAYAAGMTPVLPHERDSASALATQFEQELLALGIELKREHSERVLCWVERADDGTEVQCRTMFDNLDEAIGLDRDVKTCASGHPRAIQKHIAEYGYHVQFAAHRSALAKCFPGLNGRSLHEWLFLEMEAPHPVTIAGPTPSMEELGDLHWRQAINRWAKCTRENRWPGYSESKVLVDAPAWALQAAMEAET